MKVLRGKGSHIVAAPGKSFSLSLNPNSRRVPVVEVGLGNCEVIGCYENVSLIEVYVHNFARAQIKNGDVWRVKEIWRHGLKIHAKIVI
jgi:hypothetical protein